MELTKVLSFDKETKGTIRYSDVDGLNIYLRKSEVGYPNHPDKIKIVITEN